MIRTIRIAEMIARPPAAAASDACALRFEGRERLEDECVGGLPVGDAPYTIELWARPAASAHKRSVAVWWGQYGMTSGTCGVLFTSTGGIWHYW